MDDIVKMCVRYLKYSLEYECLNSKLVLVLLTIPQRTSKVFIFFKANNSF